MSRTIQMSIFAAAQIALVTLIWYRVVPNFEWHIVQQFYGHLGPAIFIVAMGVAALYFRDNVRAMNYREAWLAVIAGGAYILADTVIMHPPFGVFDGAGNAEQEHVSIMGLNMVLGISGLVLLRTQTEQVSFSSHFVVGISVAAMVFLNHHQHTVSGTIGHQATLIMLATAALFRVLGMMVEYAFSMMVSGFVFFSSQMGFAMAMDMGGHSGGAWVALWATFGFASATGFMAMMHRRPGVPAE